MKAIWIDPENEVVKAVETDAELASMYKLLGCDLVERVVIDARNDLWIDEEGNLKDPKHFFRIVGVAGAFSGRGLILGHDGEGNCISTTIRRLEVQFGHKPVEETKPA